MGHACTTPPQVNEEKARKEGGPPENSPTESRPEQSEATSEEKEVQPEEAPGIPEEMQPKEKTAPEPPADAPPTEQPATETTSEGVAGETISEGVAGETAPHESPGSDSVTVPEAAGDRPPTEGAGSDPVMVPEAAVDGAPSVKRLSGTMSLEVIDNVFSTKGSCSAPLTLLLSATQQVSGNFSCQVTGPAVRHVGTLVATITIQGTLQGGVLSGTASATLHNACPSAPLSGATNAQGKLKGTFSLGPCSSSGSRYSFRANAKFELSLP